MLNNDEKFGVGAGLMVPMETGSGDLATERVLLPEDAVSYLFWNFNCMHFEHSPCENVYFCDWIYYIYISLLSFVKLNGKSW